MFLRRLFHSKSLPIRPVVDLSYSLTKPTGCNKNELLEKPILITIHGIFGTKSTFRSLSKTLADALNQEVCNVELRNHGQSPQVMPYDYLTLTRDLVHFIKKHFGKERPINVMGFSLGGRVALLSALCEKVNINKCITMDLPPYTVPRLDDVLMQNYDLIQKISRREFKIEKGTTCWKNELMRLLEALPANKLDKGHPALYFSNGFLINKRNYLPFNKDIDKDPYIDFYLPLDQFPNFIEVIKTWPDLNGKGNADNYFKTSTNRQVLFMRALNSPFFNDNSKLLFKQFPKGTLKEFDTGHNMILEKPDETIGCIIDFLKNN